MFANDFKNTEEQSNDFEKLKWYLTTENIVQCALQIYFCLQYVRIRLMGPVPGPAHVVKSRRAKGQKWIIMRVKPLLLSLMNSIKASTPK